MRLLIPALIALVGIALTGCESRPAKPHHRELTQAEHDRILAHEQLPGAPVVNRALIASDRATIRNERMAAQIDSLPR